MVMDNNDIQQLINTGWERLMMVDKIWLKLSHVTHEASMFISRYDFMLQGHNLCRSSSGNKIGPSGFVLKLSSLMSFSCCSNYQVVQQHGMQIRKRCPAKMSWSKWKNLGTNLLSPMLQLTFASRQAGAMQKESALEMCPHGFPKLQRFSEGLIPSCQLCSSQSHASNSFQSRRWFISVPNHFLYSNDLRKSLENSVFNLYRYFKIICSTWMFLHSLICAASADASPGDVPRSIIKWSLLWPFFL